MMRSKCWALLAGLVLILLCVKGAYAHVGNKDIYETVTAGPYKLFVTIRTPLVIPGVATVEVRSSGAAIRALTITPLQLTGEASTHPPAADTMKVSSNDPAFFTGSLWIMSSGSWQVRFGMDGAAGHAMAGVPVPTVSTRVLKMQRPMGLLLGILGGLLVLGVVGIVAAAASEARLLPGALPDSIKLRRGRIAGVAAFLLCAIAVGLGGRWWNAEAADYTAEIHRNSKLRPTLNGNQLHLMIDTLKSFTPETGERKKDVWHPVDIADLLTDHGHLMHLYAIRWPQMDVVFHLHPAPENSTSFEETLPSMPAGDYRLYADVVFRNGFAETETATISIPAGMSNTPLGSEDASAMPPAVTSGELGTVYKLPDGYTMVWERPTSLFADSGYQFTFHLLDPQGKPAVDMQPYLGMAGHAAFVKTDGTAFAHTHPEGSAAMPAVMLASEDLPGNSMMYMSGMNMSTEPITSTVTFPYGFPSSGAYRLFIQMKHGSTVETGVFDAKVQ